MYVIGTYIRTEGCEILKIHTWIYDEKNVN